MFKYLIPASAFFSISAFAQPHIVTSIQPVSMIVSAIGGDLVTVDQLVTNQASPHDFAMRPSDLRKLDQADMVVWVGESLETFLEKPLANLSTKKDLEWLTIDGMKLRQFAAGHEDHEEHEGHEGHAKHADHEEHDDHEGHAENEGHEGHAENEGHEEHESHDEHAGHEGHNHTGVDPHVWLAPDNAKLLAKAVTLKLSELDKEHASTYQAHYQAFIQHLEKKDSEINAALETVSQVPYFVFHEAYGYFEAHYGLNNKGAITLSPERKPGAKTVANIRSEIEAHQVACVFSEPQFSPAIVETVVEGTEVKTAVLDPLGASLSLSENSYPALLEALSNQYLTCLK